jgi:hypothetical protein
LLNNQIMSFLNKNKTYSFFSTELAIRNYSTTGTSRDYLSLSNLTNLERLDLFRTSIESGPLLNILKNNSKLKHLNLGTEPILL